MPFTATVIAQTDPRLPGALLGMTSWTRAYRIEAYDPKTDRVTDTGLQPVPPGGDPSNMESVEVMVPSHDGTMVPLSIVYPTGVKLDGSRGTNMAAYRPSATYAAEASTASSGTRRARWRTSRIRGGKPVLLRVDWGAGHAGGAGLMPDFLSFLLWQMGAPAFQPRGDATR